MTNLKLTNKYREEGGHWINATSAILAYALKLCAECQEADPNSDWHLETRGTSADWHRFQGVA